MSGGSTGLLSALPGTLFVVTVYFLVIAPIPLVVASMHLGAHGDDRRWRGDDRLPGPRLGFMQ